jgi:hypothetical protein
MMDIFFIIQLLAAGLGALSTAWADWSYSGARIGPRGPQIRAGLAGRPRGGTVPPGI